MDHDGVHSRSPVGARKREVEQTRVAIFWTILDELLDREGRVAISSASLWNERPANGAFTGSVLRLLSHVRDVHQQRHPCHSNDHWEAYCWPNYCIVVWIMVKYSPGTVDCWKSCLAEVVPSLVGPAGARQLIDLPDVAVVR